MKLVINKETKDVQLNVRVKPWVLKKIDEVAKNEGASRVEVVRSLINFGLDKGLL